jgi:ABC-2 type transport system permease protein
MISRLLADGARVMAVVRRDYAVRRSYQFEFAFRFIGVAIGLIPFFYISRLVGEAEEVGRFGGYFEFALIGLVVMSGVGVALSAVNASFGGERSDGTFEILLTSPARLGAILLGSMVMPVLLFLVDAAIMLTVGVLFGLRFEVANLLVALPILILTLASFLALGGISAAITVLTKRGDPFTSLLVQGTNLLAGSLFPVAMLPVGLRFVAHLIPTFHGLNAIRAVLFEEVGFVGIMDEVAILIGFSVILFPIALLALSRAIRAARVTGTLGNY